MKFPKLFTVLAALTLTAGIQTTTFAQCRSFAKRVCRPELAPYTHSGQLSSARLSSGDKAEVRFTFTAGNEYRIVICAQPILGDITYRIMDIDHNAIYDSSKDEAAKMYYDFKVGATQQFYVEVNVPEQENPNDLMISGCVSIITGFMEKESL